MKKCNQGAGISSIIKLYYDINYFRKGRWFYVEKENIYPDGQQRWQGAETIP